ncbi:MFS transporter [Pseudomonas sp. CDFA 602]|uniref:MFS transporter n=1 Tax=Pseudomonas californiensis TaxID=2829823 RepID=UPI001E49DD40|nr:MFS transporter [Pseudomonas californiensis]MCD5993907.1 MFS transporter [Pseudomonas californiensis]MCD5999590.1 MFS transporter [Pseudomonas californiensis]
MGKDYIAFFISLFLSRLADQILLFIVPLIVFQTTQSASLAGLAFFAESLPRFLAFPVCGALCDRFSPVRILHISQVYRAVICMLAMALYGLFGGVVWLVILSALCGILTTQGVMAREVLMPYVFQRYSYTKTLSYSQIADQTGLVLGPLAAVLLLDQWAWPWVVLVCAGLFLLADLAMWVWRRISGMTFDVQRQSAGNWWQPMKIAVGHILRLTELKRIIMLAVGVNLIVGVTLATSAAMVIGEHAAAKTTYAGLQMAGAATTLVILFFLAHVAVALRALGGVSYVMIVSGALICALSPDFSGYVLGFLLIVGFDKMFNVYMRSTRQRVIPKEDFGKTVGVITLLNNLSQPFAGLAVAVLAAPLSVQKVILLLTTISIALGAIAPWLFADRRSSSALQAD